MRVAKLMLAAAMLLPAAAGARDRDGELVSTTVSVADLDLSTDAGTREMDRRIGRAVDRICGSDRACRDEAWWSTEEQAWRAVARDERMRRLAEERLAPLQACGRRGCGRSQRPAYYAPPPPPPPLPSPYGATVVTVYVGYPPPAYPPQGNCCR